MGGKTSSVTTVLIIVCIVFCVGVVVAIVGHLGAGIADDRSWRARIGRRGAARRAGRGKLT